MTLEQNLGNNGKEKIITNESVQEVVPVEVVSEEDKQAKADLKVQAEVKNNEDIAKVKEELMKQFEGGEFGKACIDNPKILDMIAEIEYCHVEDKEMKEQMINNWKKMAEKQYKEALEDFKDDPEFSQGLIYGNGGYDRYKVKEGNVYLQNDPKANLIANASAVKRAKELGMEITG